MWMDWWSIKYQLTVHFSIFLQYISLHKPTYYQFSYWQPWETHKCVDGDSRLVRWNAKSIGSRQPDLQNKDSTTLKTFCMFHILICWNIGIYCCLLSRSSSLSGDISLFFAVYYLGLYHYLVIFLYFLLFII